MSFKNVITLVSFFFLGIYGLITYYWFGVVRVVGIEFCLFLTLLISAVGLVNKKEWARKVFVGASAFGFVFNIIDIVFLTQSFQLLDAIIGSVFLLSIILYAHPLVKQLFSCAFDTPSWSILLVDDDRTFLRLMKANFFKKGIFILTAETGEKGLEIARRRKLDLIILDVILPGINGTDVCSKLKEETKTSAVPIIFLTVKDSREDIKTEQEAGAISHLTKPIDFQVLYSEIEKILGK